MHHRTDRLSLVRLICLRGMLKMEIRGTKRSGHSAYSTLRNELGLKGSRKRVLSQVDHVIDQRKKESS